MDQFFTQKLCFRCGASLAIGRILSWFKEEPICLECSKKEDDLKKALRAKGIQDAMEGCGYVPELDKI